jgi:hypothetical protein
MHYLNSLKNDRGNMRRKTQVVGWIIFCWLLTVGSLAAQAPSVQARLSNGEILIGDEVTLLLTISHDATVRLKNIGLGVLQDIEKLEVKRINPADTASRSPYNIQQEIILTSFDSGFYQLPAIPLTFTSSNGDQTISTNPLQLLVKPFPVQLTDSTDIQPIKDILKESVSMEDFFPYLLAVLLLLLIGFAIWWFFKRRNRSKLDVTPAAPALKAHELALQKLAVLQNKDWLSQGSFKEYQSELSYILREYFENRYGINALEATTFDLLKRLQTIDIENWYTQLKDILQQSDLVKFAKAEYPLDFHQEAFNQVKSFVEITQERPVIPAEEQEEQEP